jgi:mono/diheme cytochrome c family protein
VSAPWSALVVAALLASGATAHATEDDVRLRDAPGRALVEAHCVACHSLDYIAMNRPILDRKGWEASVAKMVKVMGAPIAPADATAIVDYLATQYGK